MSLLAKASNKGPRLRCVSCSVFLRSEDLGASEDVVCSGCKERSHIHVFPAFAKKAVCLSEQDVLPLDSTHCYHAEDRKAVANCGDCGRAVSEFMKVSLGADRISCLTCLQTHREDGDEFLLETRRTATDNRALMFAVLPLVAFSATLVTAFITLLFLAKDWRKGTRSPMSPGGWKFKVALAFVILQLGFWGWIVTTVDVDIPMVQMQSTSPATMDTTTQAEMEAAFEQAFRDAMKDSF